MVKLVKDIAPEKAPVVSVPELLEPITDLEALEICSDVLLPLTRLGGGIAPIAPSTKLSKQAFALSAVLRLVALFPLMFVREPRSQTLGKILCQSFPRLVGKTPKLNNSTP